MNLPEGNPNRNPDVLAQILAETRRGLVSNRSYERTLEREIAGRPSAASFRAALLEGSVGVIAEIKRRSPSAGEINPALDPVSLAASYQAGGAAAISVLTEGPHFGGSLDDLRRVNGAVGIPTLRKDFIVARVQLLEARAAGAAAVLLIVRALSDSELATLLVQAGELDLDVLVEAHDGTELSRAIDAGAQIVGVNARNLTDFSMNTAEALERLSSIPAQRVAVAESGIRGREDVMLAASHGADAVLVGGALAGADNPQQAVRALTGVDRRGR